MASTTDDLDAIRTIIDTLSSFDSGDQQRILRWACEKLGLPTSAVSTATTGPTSDERPESPRVESGTKTPSPSSTRNIKSFVTEKNPTSDVQLAATVAYFYAFEAPETQRKASISSTDLQEACRQLGRNRLARPAQTLNNAHALGLLDKGADRGTYKINTVGENLVAVALPSGASSPRTKRRSGGKKKPTKRSRNKSKPSGKHAARK